MLVLGVGEVVLARRLPRLGGLHTGDERPLGLLGLLARTRADRCRLASCAARGLDRREPGLDSRQLADRALDRATSSRELAAHLARPLERDRSRL